MLLRRTTNTWSRDNNWTVSMTTDFHHWDVAERISQFPVRWRAKNILANYFFEVKDVPSSSQFKMWKNIKCTFKNTIKKILLPVHECGVTSLSVVAGSAANSKLDQVLIDYLAS